MIHKEKRHVLPGLFIFLLLGIFAVTGTLLVLYATQVYSGTVERSDANNVDRILRSFITGTVRTGDEQGTLDVVDYRMYDAQGEISEHVYVLKQTVSSVLFEDEELDDPEDESGAAVIKRLYCHGGKLMEYVSDEADDEFDPMQGRGEELCPVADLVMDLDRESGMLNADFAGEDGKKYHVAICVRTKQ